MASLILAVGRCNSMAAKSRLSFCSSLSVARIPKAPNDDTKQLYYKSYESRMKIAWKAGARSLQVSRQF